MAGHAVDELREIFDADIDSRNVWARDVALAEHDPAAVVFMLEGQADRFRPTPSPAGTFARPRAGLRHCCAPSVATPDGGTTGAT